MKLKETFGFSPMRFLDVPSSAMAGRQVMDIVRFDDWMQQEFSYEDGKTSLSDFLTTFGSDIKDAVVELANLPQGGI